MPRPIKLSEEMLRIITAASNGMTSKEIGGELGRTTGTIDQRLAQARLMTGAINTTELVAMALRQKWIR